jgi:hypothetical protein
MAQPQFAPTRTERVIKNSVNSVLILRRELTRHDLSERERADILAAAVPALIQLEAEQDRRP